MSVPTFSHGIFGNGDGNKGSTWFNLCLEQAMHFETFSSMSFMPGHHMESLARCWHFVKP